MFDFIKKAAVKFIAKIATQKIGGIIGAIVWEVIELGLSAVAANEKGKPIPREDILNSITDILKAFNIKTADKAEIKKSVDEAERFLQTIVEFYAVLPSKNPFEIYRKFKDMGLQFFLFGDTIEPMFI